MRFLNNFWRALLHRPFALSMSMPLMVIGSMILMNSKYLPLSLTYFSPGTYTTIFAVMAIFAGAMVVIGHLLQPRYPFSARTLEIGGHGLSACIMLAYAIALSSTITTGGFMAFLVITCLGNAHLLTAVQIWLKKCTLVSRDAE